MAKNDRPDIILEGNTARWDMTINGAIHGTYMGTFRFKCFLLPTERIAAGREYRELLGSNATLVNGHEDNLAYCLTQLKYRIISAPPFWGATLQNTGMPGDVPDDNVINAVLEAAIAAELKFAEQLKDKRTGDIERAKKAAEGLLRVQDEEESDEGPDQANSD